MVLITQLKLPILYCISLLDYVPVRAVPDAAASDFVFLVVQQFLVVSQRNKQMG